MRINPVGCGQDRRGSEKSVPRGVGVCICVPVSVGLCGRVRQEGGREQSLNINEAGGAAWLTRLSNLLLISARAMISGS